MIETVLAAVFSVVSLIAGYRIGVAQRPPRPHCPQSYWAGYRKGHADGQQFATSIERTPSAN